MVDKLHLERVPRENPYKVSWVSDNQSMVVSEQAIVEFQIGQYRDKVVCDILPMSCCHMLLGRPWQFDRSAMYNGRKNTYTIEKDGRTFILSPLVEETKGQGEIIKVGRKDFVNTNEGKSIDLVANARLGRDMTVDRKSKDDLQFDGIKNSFIWKRKVDGMESQVDTMKSECKVQEMSDGILVGIGMCPIAVKGVKIQLKYASTEIGKTLNKRIEVCEVGRTLKRTVAGLIEIAKDDGTVDSEKNEVKKSMGQRVVQR